MLTKCDVKYLGLTWGCHPKLVNWSVREGSGISGVVVKYVDIGRNLGGEGGYLA